MPPTVHQHVQALQVRRTWDVHQHPQWLVFEAEGQLQIRPAQYTVAQQMMGDPGAHALKVFCKCNSGVDSCSCAWICVCVQSAHSG